MTSLRPITEAEFPAFCRAVAAQLGEPMRAEWLPALRSVAELDRSVAGFDGERMVATALAESYRMPVPGGAVGCAGITAVGVRTTHRRQGLLTAMLRRLLDDARSRGEAVAALYASEAAIYGRYGFGPAAPSLDLTWRTDVGGFLDPVDEVRGIELVEADEALARLPAVYERAQAGQPGLLSRSAPRWRLALTDEQPGVTGFMPRYHAVLEDRGYAVYRIEQGSSAGVPEGTVRLAELLATDARAYAALWQLVASVDLTTRVQAPLRPVDEPLPHLLTDPGRLAQAAGEPLHVRLVDIAAALTARTYTTAGHLVLEVSDPFMPANSGRWALDVATAPGAEVSCTATGKTPDISLDAAALAALYLGGQRWHAFARARRLTAHTPGAVARAQALFAADPLPWNARVF